jgi:phospholipase C
MGFYNVQQGDAPYLKELADTYSMSDNYHQAVQGGTGANHIMLGTGDAIWYSDGNGNAEVPPNNPVNPTDPGTPVIGHTRALSEIENPNPQPSTNNYYTQDGYGGGTGSSTAVAPNANYSGGSDRRHRAGSGSRPTGGSARAVTRGMSCPLKVQC